MIAPAWLISNWRAIGALVVVGALAAVALYYRGEAAIAELHVARVQRDLESFKGAYNVLATKVQTQNAAINEWEQKATEAARRGAQARSEAAEAVEVAMRSAEALSRRMREPAATNCPAGEGLAVVREDWRSAR